MATYGAKLSKSPTNADNYIGAKIVGKNSEVFAAGDPVSVGTSGMYVATTNSSIYGVALKAQTMTGTNATVALVAPIVQAVDQNYEFIMGCNGTGIASTTQVGVYYQLTGLTGAVQVDVSSGAQTTTSRVVVCTGVDPDGTTGKGIFKFVKVQNLTSDE